MYEKSRQLFDIARTCIPGGVNSPVRACGNVDSFPLFIDKAKGSRLWDVDGREYVDFVLSWGPMILGHADDDVERAIMDAVRRGTSYGAPCPVELALAREVVEALPGVDMVRMVNSGTEAAMSALRLARAATGRTMLVKCIGCYHGHADPFLAAAGSGVATLAIPGTPGVPPAVVADTLLVPYNDLAAAEECFDRHGEDIACLIVEPVAANMGLVLPQEGYLEGLRRLTKANGSLLILDEVITGFRVAYGGAQKRFGIDPDLTVLGKIIGGGLPVGAFGGKRRYMEMVAPQGNMYQAGTLSGNPLAMSAGLATLQALKTKDYDALERRTAKFANELGNVLARKGVAVQTPSIASMFGIFFCPELVHNFAQVGLCDQRRFTRFYSGMRERGVYLAPSAFETGMVSFAHSDEDFERALDAAKAVDF
ncbi:MAG: glutamate-1-semialdehyde 2,1-aminomutase [Desulfovibrio sp.]|jgi:glutamate-1-semialdehyde 2,1-aminomutase|nr:glutamate-1-semialdehyde 2,1-aminomutase [Desulfovibrio sp.]